MNKIKLDLQKENSVSKQCLFYWVVKRTLTVYKYAN